VNPMSYAKLVLAAAGIAVFFLGARLGIGAVRWTGIALVAAAWLLRFATRQPSAAVRDPVSPLDVAGAGPRAQSDAQSERDRSGPGDEGQQVGERRE